MTKRTKRVLTAVVAVVCAAAVFVLGYITCYFTNTSDASSLSWALSVIESKYYEDIEGDLAGVGIDAIVDEYLDIYSEYYTAEEYAELRASNAGNKTGLGVSLSYVEGSGVLVNYVLGNSPAYFAGLRAGDVLTGASYGGNSVVFSSTADLTELVSEAADGENITLYGENGAEYVAAKSSYTASYAYLCTNETAWAVTYDGSDLVLIESEGDKLEYLPDGAGYMRLLQFYGNAAEEVGELLVKFYELGCDTLYLDLRSDGGGYVSVMQQISGYFVGSGKEVMKAVYKDGSTDIYKSKTTSVNVSVEDTKVYILANNGTASASEALIGALISYDVLDYSDVFISNYTDDYITFLGTDEKNGRTYGKGIMQETVVNAATGEALKLTTAKIYWPDEESTCIHGVGLGADFGCTLVSADWSVTKNDEELQSVVSMTS